jgi:predicted DNA-binding protein (MmcQ/YjbR family)
MLDCTELPGYGLGKAGWVSVRLDGSDCPPVDVLGDWLDESYRAIAPKKLVRELDESMGA